MDPRHNPRRRFGEPSDEERERRRCGLLAGTAAEGKIGIFFGHCIRSHPRPRLSAKRSESELIESIEQIRALREDAHRRRRAPPQFWFHLSKEKQKKAPQGAGKKNGDALAGDQNDWRISKLYDRLREVAELALLQPARRPRRGIVVEGEDAVTAI